MWQPYMFSKLLPNLGALQNHPSQQRPSTSRVRGVQLTFPLQNSDPVFQQGPPAPICVPWFPFRFFFVISENGRFWWKVTSGLGRFEWWILWGENHHVPSGDGWIPYTVCFLVGWLVLLGEMNCLLFRAKIFGD